MIFLKIIPEIEIAEYFVAFYLNQANRINGYSISKGTINSTTINTPRILTETILSKSNGIITAHNHPSANLNPSDADFSITRKLNKAFELLDIRLVDNLIVTKENYRTF